MMCIHIFEKEGINIKEKTSISQFLFLKKSIILRAFPDNAWTYPRNFL